MAGGVLLQSAATSGNGNVWHCRGEEGTYTLTVIGTGTISAGAVQWEAAPEADYAGTWAPLGSAISVISGTVLRQAFSGNPAHVRARLSTSVAGGGSVTVRMQPPLVGGES